MQSACLLSPVASLTVPYFSTLSRKGHDFRKTLFKKKCVIWFSLQLLSETFLILRRTQRDIIINVHRSSYKVPLLLSDFNEPWNVSTEFRKIFKCQISWKSVQWEQSCSMRTDRRTDRHDEASSLFSQFCESAWEIKRSNAHFNLRWKTRAN